MRLLKIFNRLDSSMKVDIKYLAGLIDGEGFFTINYRKKKQSEKGMSHEFTPVVGVHMTATKLLHRIQKQYGGNIYERMGTNRIRADWSIRQARNVHSFLEQIIPHLIVKKKQAILLKDFCERFEGLSGKEVYKLDEKEIKKRKSIKEELTKINKEQS